MSGLQGRVKALQEQLAAAMAEQEVGVSRVRAASVEEAGRGTSLRRASISQDGEEEEALRATEVELEGSLEGCGGRAAMDGAF